MRAAGLERLVRADGVSAAEQHGGPASSAFESPREHRRAVAHEPWARRRLGAAARRRAPLVRRALARDPPLAAVALGRSLHAAGLPVTPDRSATFAAAAALLGPARPRRALLGRAPRASSPRATSCRSSTPCSRSLVDGIADPAASGAATRPRRRRRAQRGRPRRRRAARRGARRAAPARRPGGDAATRERRATSSVGARRQRRRAARGRAARRARRGRARARRRARPAPRARHAAAPRAPRAAVAPRRAPRRARDAAPQPPHGRRPRRPAAPPPPRAPAAAGRAARRLRLDGALRPRLPAAARGRRARRAAPRPSSSPRGSRASRARCARAAPSAALERASAAAPDWAGGTRIGEALRAFNDRFGRRGMARDAVVVVLSDGWERGDPALARPRDGAAGAARLPDRVGQPARRGARVRARDGRHGGGAAARRRAGQRPQLAALDDVVAAIGRHR